MVRLSSDEIYEINGGGLTVVETLGYIGALAISGPYTVLTAAGIIILEYQDYKNGP